MANETFKGLFKQVKKDLRAATAESVRHAAVEIMNGLANAGPGYSGAFSSAWYAVKPGTEPGGPRSVGSMYRYDLRNVPAIKFQEGTYYEIVNGVDYAPQALDLEEGRFKSQYDEDGDILNPIKKPIAIGKRTGKKRGDVTSGEGFAVSTAPQDWYVNYSMGGSLVLALENGVKIGFRQGPLGGQGNSPRGFG